MTFPTNITKTIPYSPLDIQTVSTRPQKPIEIINPNPNWLLTFETLKTRIQTALGPTALSIQHVGSTSVPNLPAKDIIDIDLIVPNPTAEETFVPALEALGFQFLFREPKWYEHRFFGLEEPYTNLHVFGPGCAEAARHLLFRDWLRGHEGDCLRYAVVKREAAAASRGAGETVMQYNDRKEAVIRDILRRAYEANGLL